MSSDNRERLLDALRSSDVSTACLSCGRDEWMQPGATSDLMALVPVTDADNRIVGAKGMTGGIGAYFLTCEFCGLVRMHSEQVIDAIAESP